MLYIKQISMCHNTDNRAKTHLEADFLVFGCWRFKSRLNSHADMPINVYFQILYFFLQVISDFRSYLIILHRHSCVEIEIEESVIPRANVDWCISCHVAKFVSFVPDLVVCQLFSQISH